MNRSIGWWLRKLHRHGSLIIALPLLVVIGSGFLLLLKKESDWIQPPTQRGAGGPPVVPFADILGAARGVPEAKIDDWGDIDRLDVRPDRGIVKVRGKAGIEIQVDTATGAVLQVMPRRSDLIESIHDGTFFHSRVKLWVFLPSALILLFLLVSGVWLWFQPVLKRRARRAARPADKMVA